MISSRGNERLKRARALHDRRGRRRTGLFLAEGQDLVEAALAQGIEPVELFLRGETTLPGVLGSLEGRATAVEPGLLDELATINQGSDVIGVYRATDLRSTGAGAGPTLVLAGVSDPGNVGTLIRSAAAFDARQVILGPGSADPLGPRAVRASMGGVFAVSVLSVSELVQSLNGLRLVALAPTAELTIDSIDLLGDTAIVIGAERAGVPSDVLGRAGVIASIPQSAAVESLNAGMAGTIALWEAARQRRGCGG